jgi:hypothetical protein
MRTPPTSRLPVEDYERLRRYAFGIRSSINAVVLRAVVKHLDANDG